ncbi:MgtC/SapB family protein [Rhodocyclus purpureus]|uniref:MgtC/SapB family protein n=1 Tax=Rhodocyclus purpureus TaxID=1067 RepID=UPI0019144BDE|nr:MgtC/SapB family protein [Rhodocyclus purpureus]
MNGELLDTAGLDILPDLLISLGVGLLIGLERERNPASRAGLRTFGLVGLLGAVCALIASRLDSPWIIAAGLVTVGSIAFLTWRRLGAPADAPELALRNPTELRTALSFAAVYGIVLFCSAALSETAGTVGIYVFSLITGFTDVDPIALSSLRLFGQGKLAANETATSILIALLANLVFKLGIIGVVGGRRLARAALAGFAALAGGSIAGWALLGLL